jgi:hypothetical protein
MLVCYSGTDTGIQNNVRRKRLPRRRKRMGRGETEPAAAMEEALKKAQREQEAEERAKMRAHSAKTGSPAVPHAEGGWRSRTAGGASSPTTALTTEQRQAQRLAASHLKAARQDVFAPSWRNNEQATQRDAICVRDFSVSERSNGRRGPPNHSAWRG